jgi:hypothetical protein
MLENMNILWGILFLLIGIPIGNFLAKFTIEELDSGQKWFKIIIWICLVGAFFSLIFYKNILLFSFLFIAVVTSRCLKRLIL